jgi:predicted transcriptional regulator
MSSNDVKQAAHELLDSFPESVTWDEVACRMEVRASIERGFRDVEAGRVFSHDEVKERFGVED